MITFVSAYVRFSRSLNRNGAKMADPPASEPMIIPRSATQRGVLFVSRHRSG